MSKKRGFNQLVGRMVTKVKVVDNNILVCTEDAKFHIWLNSQTGLIECSEDTKMAKIPESANKLWPFPLGPFNPEGIKK